MNMKKQVIILDFDGTLYSNEHKFDLIPDLIKKNKRSFLPHISDDDYNKICEETPCWTSAIFSSEITQAITEIKSKYPHLPISTKDFSNWSNQSINPILIDPNQIVDLNFLQSLCKNYPTYIVSNSSHAHITHYMKKLGINPLWFQEILSNTFDEADTTKRPHYEYVAKKENIKTSQLYVFGDSKTSDLEPALKINANIGHIQDARLLPYVVKKALNLDTSSEKKYLRNLLNSYNNNNQNPEFLHQKELLVKHIKELNITN